MSERLTKGDILKVVNRYIGVSGGYLGNFTYTKHEEFYPEYCGLDSINPSALAGTTRERFIAILEGASSEDQAKILRGVVKRFPPDTYQRSKVHPEIEAMITRLESGAPVARPDPKVTSAALKRAIEDAETLIRSRGAENGVDRIHTALHAYLLAVCDAEKIGYPPDVGITGLFKVLLENHRGFRPAGAQREDVVKILRALATIMSALEPIRNRGSGAHPNPEVLDAPEAMLVINVARSILHYLDAKV